jgi:hypothetical protein
MATKTDFELWQTIDQQRAEINRLQRECDGLRLRLHEYHQNYYKVLEYWKRSVEPVSHDWLVW